MRTVLKTLLYWRLTLPAKLSVELTRYLKILLKIGYSIVWTYILKLRMHEEVI